MLRHSLAQGDDLRRINVFRDLADGELQLIHPTLRQKAVKRGSTLVVSRDLRELACFVWSGFHRLVIAVPPNRPVALRILKPGDAFGLLSGGESEPWSDHLRLECDEPGLIVVMAAKELEGFRRAMPALAEAIQAAIAAVAAEYYSRIYELTALTIPERLLAELLRSAHASNRRSGACVVRPSRTHKALAEQIGASREGVSRALNTLARQNLIRVNRGVIELLDIGRMLELDQDAADRLMFDPGQHESGRP